MCISTNYFYTYKKSDGGIKLIETRLFLLVSCYRTGGTGDKVKHRKFYINVTQARIFTVRRVKLPRNFLYPSAMKTFKPLRDLKVLP